MKYAPFPQASYVSQGQVHVSKTPEKMFTCILGSCVAACLRDRNLLIGGMNHFLLPGRAPHASGLLRYGEDSMTALMDALLSEGATQQGLEVWLYGGADVLGAGTGIGADNAKCALAFVQDAGLKVRASDLGGFRGRRVTFQPFTGAPEVTMMEHRSTGDDTARRPYDPM